MNKLFRVCFLPHFLFLLIFLQLFYLFLHHPGPSHGLNGSLTDSLTLSWGCHLPSDLGELVVFFYASSIFLTVVGSKYCSFAPFVTPYTGCYEEASLEWFLSRVCFLHIPLLPPSSPPHLLQFLGGNLTISLKFLIKFTFISNGFQLVFHWNSNWISIRFQLSFHWLFNWISNG